MNRKPNKIALHTTFTESDLRLCMTETEFCNFIETWYKRKIALRIKETVKTDFEPQQKKFNTTKIKGYFSATGEFNNKQE